VVPSSFTASATPQNVAVSLVTQGQMFGPPPYSQQRRPGRRLLAYPVALCVLLAALFLVAARRRAGVSFGWIGNARFAIVLAAVIMVGVFGLAGCGSTSGVTRGNVNLMITATSGGVSHSAPITVIVQ
jgi:hypothetical protein